MADPNVKLIRALRSPTTFDVANRDAAPFFNKLLYEFWGYVVNGGDDPTVAGGIATGGLDFPAGFESGSVTTTGTGGSTTFPSTRFVTPTPATELNASGVLRNNYLVMWQSGSASPDDGIYRIVSADDDGLILDMDSGGTPRLGNKPTFRDRTGINFRIVDIQATAELGGWADGQSMVLQFNGAADVNPGQALSQVQLILRNQQEDIGIIVSPSGSWNGSAFTDGSDELLKTWFEQDSGAGLFYMAGGSDFLVVHVNGIDLDWQTTDRPAGLHIEIPQRLYPREYDPNPVTWMAFGGEIAASISQIEIAPANSYYDGFRMIGFDGVDRAWRTITRSPHGDRVNTNFALSTQGVWEEFEPGERFSEMTYNPHIHKVLSSDGLLHLDVAGQFALARCRLRRVRFTSDARSPSDRFGTEWVFVDNGILWPWNNTIIPYGAFWEGA
jgi:hypothetical protein